MIAWLAGEQWVNEVFATHGKIYEATASQMFHVPIEKIVKGNPEYALRQKEGGYLGPWVPGRDLCSDRNGGVKHGPL